MSIERARKIKVILFDVDGVLTDGTIWLFPAPAGTEQSTAQHAEQYAAGGGYAVVSKTMIEAKGFHAHDGTSISLAKLGGLKVGIVTKRISETVAIRARDLKLDYVYQGQANKLEAFHDVMQKAEVGPEEVAFVGDDVIDLPIMRRCGLAIAVPNGRQLVKDTAHWVTPNPGGAGAGRDAVEYILSAKGILEDVIETYIEERKLAPAGISTGHN
jgi:3-deoxy-D-manno-octulosonate 8-phosphate phosphatase (KDO 8-P phosphatase)